MSFASRRPLRMLGGNQYSGAPYTGEFPHVRGGALAATIWSGNILTNAALAPGTQSGAIQSGGHVCFFTGAGRVNNALVMNTLVSGQPVFFYDGSTPALSGVSVSGLRLLGVIPTPFQPYMAAGFVSGGQNPQWQWRYEFDTPFQSGLCAAIPSGAPAFTVSYTPEVVPVTGE